MNCNAELWKPFNVSVLKNVIGHRPRWMALGILTIVIYCLVNVIPHFLYGPGEDSLLLTVEYGAVKDDEKTKAVQEMDNNLLICQRNGNLPVIYQ